MSDVDELDVRVDVNTGLIVGSGRARAEAQVAQIDGGDRLGPPPRHRYR